MAEPGFVAAGAYLDGSGTSANVGVPAGTAAGRVVLVTIFMDGNPLASNPTPPAEFALAPNAPVQIPAQSGSHSLYLYWKRLTGADAGTYNFTWAESRYREAQAFLYQDVVASGTPFDPSPGAAFETTSNTVTPAVSCTSAGPDRRLIFAATNWAGGTWTAPTSHTKRMQGGAGVVTLTDRSWPTASGTGNVTATCTGSDKRNAWIGALIGTTGGTPTVPVAGSSLTAAVPYVAARKVAAVSATVSVALAGTAPARKVAPVAASGSGAMAASAAVRKAAPASGRACLAAVAVSTARKLTPAAGLTWAAATSTAGASKIAPSSGVAAGAVVTTAAARKVAPGGGTTYAAAWSYRSQVVTRSVTAVCSAAVVGSAATRKVLPASGVTPLAAYGRASAAHVALATGIASVAVAGRAQTGRVAVVTARGVLAVAAVAGARKIAPAAGRAYAVALPLRVVPQEEADLVGTLFASDGPRAHLATSAGRVAVLSSMSSAAVLQGGDE